MPKGYSLHIGVNRVDLNHYIKLHELRAAVNDAKFMLTVAQDIYKYDRSEILLNEQATTQNVAKILGEYATALKSGDTLLISYSGHGGLVEDPDWMIKGEDEPTDSTWCLYDRQLIDDEIFALFKTFKTGVRILVVSDSCHSGTVTRVLDGSAEAKLEEEIAALMIKYDFLPKTLTPDEAMNIQTQNNKIYEEVQDKLKRSSKNNLNEIKAAVMLFAACQDHQVAYDGLKHGRFTSALKQLIENDYMGAKDAKGIYNLLKSVFTYPVPNLFLYGAQIPAFEDSIPFLINKAGKKDVVTKIRKPETPSAPSPLQDPKPQPVTSESLRVSISVEAPVLDDELLARLIPPGVKRMSRNGQELVFEMDPSLYTNVWDAVYAVSALADKLKVTADIEPASASAVPLIDITEIAKNASESFDYMAQWPPEDQKLDPDWYLGESHSQLAAARKAIMDDIAKGKIPGTVRIGHLDTGYWPSHPAIMSNKNIRRDLAKSFVAGEQANPALDIFYGKNEQQNHGLGTLCILAGGNVKSEFLYGLDVPYTGAVPFAEVIPIRIADSVVILDTDTFCDGLDYAIEQGCEVVTMSMGGKPSRKMAKAINRAYEAGVVVVTAAGNSMTKGVAAVGPRTVVWPARFARVTAACGVSQNHLPYDFDAQKQFTKGSLDHMQGNWGPESAMQYAIAAYTPNVLWASRDEQKPFKKSGGGTSSATPQVAAAAAMYIAKYREEMKAKGYYNEGQKWKKVEAVRRALFQAADKTTFPESKKYYGNGILKAKNSLEVKVLDIKDNMKAPEASSSWFGLSEAIGIIINRKRAQVPLDLGKNQKQALALEIAHVMMNDESLAELYNSLSTEKSWDEATLNRVTDAVRASRYCSEGLRRVL
jgi:subtilisin family serine protease